MPEHLESAAGEIAHPPLPPAYGPAGGTVLRASDRSEGEQWPLSHTVALVSLASALLWTLILAAVVRLIA